MSEPGQDSASFQGLRTWFHNVVQDPGKLRLYSHLALVAVGWFALISPLGDRLAKARKSLDKAHRNEARAKAHVHLVDQREQYEPLITGSEDLLDWQSFVLSKVDAAGVRLVSFEPYKADRRGDFQVMRFNINVMSDEYASLADFIDRLEHGERLVRLESLVLTQSSQSMVMTFMMRGMVLPGQPDVPLQDPLGPGTEVNLELPDELPEAPGDSPLELDPEALLALEDDADALLRPSGSGPAEAAEGAEGAPAGGGAEPPVEPVRAADIDDPESGL